MHQSIPPQGVRVLASAADVEALLIEVTEGFKARGYARSELMDLHVKQMSGNTVSAGAAGSVRGGDRLPWVETEPGKDNFTPLASLAWQVHVYGKPRGGIAEACAELRLHSIFLPGSRQCGEQA